MVAVVVTTTTEVPKHEQSSHFNAMFPQSYVSAYFIPNYELPLNLPRF